MSKIITNSRGGRQSEISGRITEVPPLALIEVSKIMGEGSRVYPRESDGTPNWHRIGCVENLDHGLLHAFNFLAERNKHTRDSNYMLEELAHHTARAMMALEQFLRGDL